MAIPHPYDHVNRQKGRYIELIRHGESFTNIGMAATRTEDVALTFKGLQQAQQIAENISWISKPDLIISSPYKRAIETAQPTINRFWMVPSVIWDEVKEFNYLESLNGLYTSRSERSEKRKAFWGGYDPTKQDGNGESFRQFIQRVIGVQERLKNRSERIIYVFAHEQFIIAFLCLIHKHIEGYSSSDCMRKFRGYLNEYHIANGQKIRVHIGADGSFHLDDFVFPHPVPQASFSLVESR